MAQASLQINQLLGEGNALIQKRKGKLNPEDAILGQGNALADFSNFLAALGQPQVGTPITISKALTPAAATAGNAKTSAIAATLTPEQILAALKRLTPEQLATLKIDVATAITSDPTTFANILAGTDTGNTSDTLGILDALSTLEILGGDMPEFFTVVDDPKLAAMLGNLGAQLRGLQAAIAPVATDATPAPIIAASPIAGIMPQILNQATVVDADTLKKLGIDIGTASNGVIVIPNTEGDTFDALKKLAFSDIAPFLTQPRTVRIDSHAVMKVAQGPAFLNDDNTDSTVMNFLAGLVPVLIKAAQTQTLPATGEKSPAVQTAAGGVLPNVQTATTPAAAAPVIPTIKTNIFASLLARQAADTSHAPVTDPSVVATPVVAQNAATAQATQAATPVMDPLQMVQQKSPAAQTVLVTVTPIATGKTASATAKGLDNALADPATFDLSTTFDEALRIRADQSSAANSSTALISAKSASSAHPATHLVSLALQRAASDMPQGMVSERQFTIQLDPPNLGRVKITLDFAENGTVKAKLMAERPETVSMLQKDSSALERSLHDSGFDASAPGALTFDVAQDNAFSQNFREGSQGEGSGKSGADEDGTDFAIEETVMPIFVDPLTGLTHVNVVI